MQLIVFQQGTIVCSNTILQVQSIVQQKLSYNILLLATTHRDVFELSSKFHSCVSIVNAKRATTVPQRTICVQYNIRAYSRVQQEQSCANIASTKE